MDIFIVAQRLLKIVNVKVLVEIENLFILTVLALITVCIARAA